jgi:protein required for attachment to host cells
MEILMLVPQGAVIAVADGEKFSLFRNTGSEVNPSLAAMQTGEVNTDNKSGGARHISGAANPDESQIEEDSFSAGIAGILNAQAIEGKIKDLVVIAAPRTLGELRRHYHQKLKDVLVGEIPKDFAGHTSGDIEKALAAA